MPRKRKPTNGAQQRIPGTQHHPEIEAKAEEVFEVRTHRQKLQGKEKELKDELRTLCVKHGVAHYRLDDADPPLEVKVEEREPSVSVRKQKTPKGAEGGRTGDEETDAALHS